MVNRYRNGAIPAPGPASDLEEDLQSVAAGTRQRAEKALEVWEIGNALQSIWSFVRRTNQDLEQSEPWQLARLPEKGAQLDTALYSSAEAMRPVAVFRSPFTPGPPTRILGTWSHV